MDNPSLVFMLSGKRKSGKDFLADYLKGENKMYFLVIRLLKKYFKREKDSPSRNYALVYGTSKTLWMKD